VISRTVTGTKVKKSQFWLDKKVIILGAKYF